MSVRSAGLEDEASETFGHGKGQAGALASLLPAWYGPEGLSLLEAVLVSFSVIFVAELGDKSQLMALTFATRYRPLPILAGVAIATAIVHAVSVAIGLAIEEALPTAWITLAAAAAFFVFALWTLRGDALSESDERRVRRTAGTAVLATGTAFFLAELGDKTMLATVTLATQLGPFGAWLGSTVGMVAADALAIAVGRFLGVRLPEQAVRVGAALCFAAFGVVLTLRAAAALTGSA